MPPRRLCDDEGRAHRTQSLARPAFAPAAAPCAEWQPRGRRRRGGWRFHRAVDGLLPEAARSVSFGRRGRASPRRLRCVGSQRWLGRRRVCVRPRHICGDVEPRPGISARSRAACVGRRDRPCDQGRRHRVRIPQGRNDPFRPQCSPARASTPRGRPRTRSGVHRRRLPTVVARPDPIDRCGRWCPRRTLLRSYRSGRPRTARHRPGRCM